MRPETFTCSVWDFMVVSVIFPALTHVYTHADMHAGTHAYQIRKGGAGGNCGEPIAPQLGVAFWIDVGRQMKGL